MEREDSAEKITESPASPEVGFGPEVEKEHQEKEVSSANGFENSPAFDTKEEYTFGIQENDEKVKSVVNISTMDSPTAGIKERNSIDIQKDDHVEDDTIEKNIMYDINAESTREPALDSQQDEEGDAHANEKTPRVIMEVDTSDFQKDDEEKKLYTEKNIKTDECHEEEVQPGACEVQDDDQVEVFEETGSLNITKEQSEVEQVREADDSNEKRREHGHLDSENQVSDKSPKESLNEEAAAEPVFDGTEVSDLEMQGAAWPERAAAITNLVKEKSVVAVSCVLRRLSGKSDDGPDSPSSEDRNRTNTKIREEDIDVSRERQEVAQKVGEGSGWWVPLGLIKLSSDADADNKIEPRDEVADELSECFTMKGRILLYSRLGCQNCKEARLFLHKKRLRYVEINIDVYPSRKLELEKITGSSTVPIVFFNEVLIGGLNELNTLDESGLLKEKIDFVFTERPSFEAPLPPLSGEDDTSSSGAVDELALIVQKMKGSIVVKDRFHKMRRFTNSFLGSEAVDFLSEDQYLERDEAIELGRKLASKLFFNQVLDENLFEDSCHLYRFLDDDPLVSQCQNIPSGICELKAKSIEEISPRLGFLSYAIYEAYTSPDGRHVDYRSIHGSEEFARYLRIIEELQRVDLQDMPREDKLAFFINLYNMMAIHAILVWGHPAGALERRKLFGDFKYVIGGCTYSLSAIYNGILRSNRRPPYNFIKPFGIKDKRFKTSLPYPEPLVHFALVNGHRSGPALRCYSPADIDKELMEAARSFLQNGGLVVDFSAKVAFASVLLKWYSVDFGRNEVEVLKHAANYLEAAESQTLLEILADSQLKVVYQTYDWGLNH